MDKHRNQPKPDDRSDNVEKIQENIENTLENMYEAEESLEYSSGDQREQIKAKNERRKEAIEGMREEVKDEYNNQQNE